MDFPCCSVKECFLCCHAYSLLEAEVFRESPELEATEFERKASGHALAMSYGRGRMAPETEWAVTHEPRAESVGRIRSYDDACVRSHAGDLFDTSS
jgi:hypothetical protein